MGRPSSFLLASVSTLALLTATPSIADTVNWIGPDGGTWDDGNNWDSGQQPQNGQDTNLTQGGASDQTAIYQNPTPGTTLNSLVIDGTGGGLMALSHQQDALSTNTLTIGASGKGQYTLDGTGALTVSGDLVLGSQAGNESPNSKGTFNFNTQGGTATLSVSGTIVVGDSGDGVFSHGAGTVSANVVIGRNVGSNGTYNLLGGSAFTPTPPILNDDLIVGDAGTGTFNNNASAHTVSGNLILGNQSTGKGTYNLSGGGTLDVAADALGNANLIIGDDGNGQFIHTDGSTATVAGSVVLGNNGGGAGRYRLDSGTLNIGGELSVGGSDQLTTTITGGTGHFVQNDGTVNVGNTLFVGNAGGTGTYDLHGGTLDATNGGTSPNPVSFVGNTSTGTFNQDGGTHITSFLGVGTIGGGTGTYNLSGGTVQVQGNLGIGGDTSSGLIDQTGGTVTVGGTIFMNGNGNADSAKYKLTGDPNSVSLTVTGNTIIGANGLAGSVFEQSGGTHTTSGLFIGGDADINNYNSSAAGAYKMSGGVLNVGLASIGQFGVGTFDQSGGTVNAGTVVLGSIGSTINSQGTYTLTGTGALIADTLVVGGLGNGTFKQGDGGNTSSVTVNGMLTVGDAVRVNPDGAPPRQGTYTLNDGSLTTFNTTVANQGVGTFNQSGGTHTVSNDLTVGAQFVTPFDDGNGAIVGGPSSGTYNLTGGTLSVGGGSVVGDKGGGVFTQTGGTHNVTLDLIVGNRTGSTGSYDFSGANPSLSVGRNLVVGNSGTGTFTASGPNDGQNFISVGNNLIVGNFNGGNGTFTLNDGTTVNVGTTGASTPGTGILSLGVEPGSTGTFNMNGGNLNVQGNSSFQNSAMEVGSGGAGLFIQTGGNVSTFGANGLAIGDCCGGSGEYRLSGGTLSLNQNSDIGSGSGNMFVGAHTTGTMTQTGGSVTVAGDAFVGFADGAIGQYTMNDSAGNGAPSLQVGGNMIVGGSGFPTVGVGQVDHAAGSITIGLDLTLGASLGSTGTYNLSGTGTLGVTGNVIIGDAGTGTFTQDGGTHTIGGDLNIGRSSDGDGSYTYNGGTLSVSGLTVVGDAGTGTFNQNADLTLAGRLVIGRGVGGNGTYNLNGKTLIDDLVVGDAGTGTFNNAGGTHNVTGALILGNASTGDGTYNLTAGGKLTVSTNDFTIVGAAGTGTFLNDASTHDTGGLVIGQQSGATGLYTLQNGGVLNVNGSSTTGFMSVGESGTGSYTQTGGTATIATSLAVGLNSDGTGFLNLSGGSMTVGTFTDVGLDGIGTVTHNGDATLTVTNDLNIGRNANSLGTYSLTDTATLTVNGTLNIGNAGTGLFTQNGGTLNAKGDENIGITGFGSFTQTAGAHNVAGDLNLGFSDSGLGQYQLSGTGSLAVTGTLFLGDAGIGTFTQQDAATSVTAKSLSVGNNANGFGQYDLKGGSLQTESSFVGASGTGIFNQSGGSHTVTVGGLSVGNNAGGNGTYSLSGGTLSVTGGTFLGSGDSGAISTGTMVQSGTSLFTTDKLAVGNGAIGQGFYTLKDSASLTVNGTTFVGGGGLGTFTQSDTSSHTTDFLVLGNSSGSTGTYDLKGGTITVKNDETIGSAGTGTVNQSGGTHTVTGALTVAANSGGTGSFNLSGGSLAAGTIVNKGTFTYSGGALKTTTFTNDANTTLSGAGERKVGGAVVNNGTWTVDHTTATYAGTFTNSGKYVSDPSTNNFVDFVITASGSVQGGPGDVFHVTGDFKNASTQASLWTTDQSKLVIDGSGNGKDGKHRLEFAGIDEGATFAGYADNFAWGELDLASGEEIDTFDGNDIAGAAFYTRLFQLAGHDLRLLAEILSPFNIYYDATLAGNAYLDCKNYDLQGGGALIAIGECTVTPRGEVPEPGTLTLLGLGLGGLVFLRRRGRGIEAPRRV